MKILQINTVYGVGSTGKIVKEIHDACKKENISCISAYRCSENGSQLPEDTIEISSPIDSRIHGVLSRITMFKGCFSFFKTVKFLKKIKRYSPDIIHLHNLHGSYVNIPLLFRYIKKNDIQVVWTLHDCWPFTAICSHFSAVDCDKWITVCNNCPLRKELSQSLVDNTGSVWKYKKHCFTSAEKIVFAAPSNWMKGLLNKSFLKQYPAVTINNGIDLTVFKPSKSDFKAKYNLKDKYIVLGVAFEWGYKKGLDVFIKLSGILSDEYKIVLVGTNDGTESQLPANILSVKKTDNQQQLAEIYSSADVFVNPTREETLGLVNIEALACGTPVVTFNAGGSPECVDALCGSVVEIDDTDAVKSEIVRICTEKPYSKENCIKQAAMFDKDEKLSEYIELYKKMLN